MKIILSDDTNYEKLNLIDGRAPQMAMTALIGQSFTTRPWLACDVNNGTDKALQAILAKHPWAFQNYATSGTSYWTLTCAVWRLDRAVMS